MSNLITEDFVREKNAVFVFCLRDQMLEFCMNLKNGAGACGRGFSPASLPPSMYLILTILNLNILQVRIQHFLCLKYIFHFDGAWCKGAKVQSIQYLILQ